MLPGDRWGGWKRKGSGTTRDFIYNTRQTDQQKEGRRLFIGLRKVSWWEGVRVSDTKSTMVETNTEVSSVYWVRTG